MYTRSTLSYLFKETAEDLGNVSVQSLTVTLGEVSIKCSPTIKIMTIKILFLT